MSNELDKVAEEKVTLMIGGKEREIKFGFSTWGKLTKEFGGLDKLDKLQEEVEKDPFTIIPKLIWIALKDKEGLEEETFLDEYGIADIGVVTEAFQKALYGSLPKDGKKGRTKKAVKEA